MKIFDLFLLLFMLAVLFNASCQIYAPTYIEADDSLRTLALSTARAYVGVPYVWGGQIIQSGVDCSGLVIEAYRIALEETCLGKLPYRDTTAYELYNKYSTEIPIPEIGDLLFMGEEGVVSHVALCVEMSDTDITFIDAYSVTGIVGIRKYEVTNPKFIAYGRIIYRGF